MAVQQFADRVADLGRPELVGGDLIEQRLERVVVVLVDDREPDRRVAQLLRRADAAEAGAEDHDMWLGILALVEGMVSRVASDAAKRATL